MRISGAKSSQGVAVPVLMNSNSYCLMGNEDMIILDKQQPYFDVFLPQSYFYCNNSTDTDTRSELCIIK